MLNHQPVYTFDARDQGQAAVGKYADVSFGFTAVASPENLRFEFLVGEPNAVVRLDNVAITKGLKGAWVEIMKV